MPLESTENWPTALDDYEPVEELSVGRISTVVRATDKTTNRSVALKILHDHLADNEAVRRRIRREFAAIRRLDHPAIVRADNLVDTDETVALVMEYVHGQTIRELIERDGPLSWDRTRRILDDVLAGLNYAHEHHIWHRDLNARHVIVGDDDTGTIIGFGMANVGELAALTMHTRVLGALEATAPERLLGMDHDARADLYSVGAVAHEMLAGFAPVDPTVHSALSDARQRENLLDNEVRDALPQDARYVLERSLVSDVSARFSTADQMRRALGGAYDEKMWKHWVSRRTGSCPECDHPLTAGLPECIYCGYEIPRLVRRPGNGNSMIRIISPREDFVPDTWLEENPEPGHLPADRVDSLMRLLQQYEDTRRIAEWNPRFQLPPYVLFDQLTEEDANRISELLASRSIPHVVEARTPSVWKRARTWLGDALGLQNFGKWAVHQALGGLAVLLPGQSSRWDELVDRFQYFGRTGSDPRPNPLWVLIVLVLFVPLVTLRNLFRRRPWAMTTMTAGALLIVVLAAGTELVGTNMFASGLAAFAASVVFFRIGVATLRRRFDLRDDRPKLAGYPLMIPSQVLRQPRLSSNRVTLPEHTPRILRELQTEEVRRELQELLALSLAVAGDQPHLETKKLSSFIERALSVGRSLDEAIQRHQQVDATRVYRRLEHLDRRLNDANTKERSALLEAHNDCLELLQQHDENRDRVEQLRSALILSRGALFDLWSNAENDGESLSLLDDQIDEILGEIETRTEAIEEVELETGHG